MAGIALLILIVGGLAGGWVFLGLIVTGAIKVTVERVKKGK